MKTKRKVVFGIFLFIYFFSSIVLSACAEKENDHTVKKVFETDKGIFFDTDSVKNNALILNDPSDPGFLLGFNLEDISECKNWVILSVSIGHEGPGSVAEFWELFFVPEKKMVPRTILGGSVYFIEKDEKGEYVKLNDERVYLKHLLNKKKKFQDIKAYVDDLKK